MHASFCRKLCCALIPAFLAACASQSTPGVATIDGAGTMSFDKIVPPPYDPALLANVNNIPVQTAEYSRNNITAHYIKESEILCSAYIQELTRVSRDNNLIFGTLATVLSTMGAAFTRADSDHFAL